MKGCLLEIISHFFGIFVRFRRFYLYKFYKISIFFIRIGRIELHFALRSIERSGNEIGHLIKSCIHKVFSIAAIRYQSRDVYPIRTKKKFLIEYVSRSSRVPCLDRRWNFERKDKIVRGYGGNKTRILNESLV